MKNIIEKLVEFSSSQLTVEEIAFSLLVALLFGIFVYFINRVLSQKELYSMNFGISLIAVAIVTDAIIVAIQNSLVVSLGMVGALSIVRFRTAVKDPLDLVFLFWSISMGIVSGSGLYYLGIFTSLLLAATLLIFKSIPKMSQPLVLTVQYKGLSNSGEVQQIIKASSKKNYKKSQSVRNDEVSCVYEINTKSETHILKELSNLPYVTYVGIVEPSNIIS